MDVNLFLFVCVGCVMMCCVLMMEWDGENRARGFASASNATRMSVNVDDEVKNVKDDDVVVDLDVEFGVLKSVKVVEIVD